MNDEGRHSGDRGGGLAFNMKADPSGTIFLPLARLARYFFVPFLSCPPVDPSKGVTMNNRFTPRSSRVPFLAALVLAGACTDEPLSPESRREPAQILVEYECVVEVTAETTDCQPVSIDQRSAGPHLDVSLGSGTPGVTFLSQWTHSRGNTTDEDTSTNMLGFINNIGQSIGTADGSTPHVNGNRLFFVNGPTVTKVYTGTVASAYIGLDAPDGTGWIADSAGVVINRPYYQYDGIVVPGDTSTASEIRFIYSSNVKSFAYRYRISAPVKYEYGWIAISPITPPVLAPAQTTTFTAAVFDMLGSPLIEPIQWSSSNTVVAVVDASTGQVTAVGQGTATIAATSTVNAQRTGTRVLTVDAAPTVTGTIPTNSATGIEATGDIAVTFSEAVNVTGSAFALECPVGSSQAFSVSGNGTSTITLNPNGNLPAATACTVVMDANQVSDVDTDDGPNLMAGNYSFSFEVAIQAIDDLLPDTITGPINTANASPVFSVLDNDAIDASTTIAFAGWNGAPGTSMAGGQLTMTTSGAGMGQFVYYPPAGYSGTDSLEYTIQSGAATSTAKVALPVHTATQADAAPVVLSTTPEDGEAPVAADADIMIFFSEAVNVSTSSFLLECPVGEGELAFTVNGSGTSTITLDPEADLPEQAICTVTVAASAVSDADANDGPDVMAADYVFSFEVGITIHP